VLEKIISVKNIEAVDTLFLIVMSKDITKVSQDLTSKIMGFKISDFPGENYIKAVSKLHGAIPNFVYQVHNLPGLKLFSSLRSFSRWLEP